MAILIQNRVSRNRHLLVLHEEDELVTGVVVDAYEGVLERADCATLERADDVSVNETAYVRRLVNIVGPMRQAGGVRFQAVNTGVPASFGDAPWDVGGELVQPVEDVARKVETMV